MLTKEQLSQLQNEHDQIMVKYDNNNPLTLLAAPTQRKVDRPKVNVIKKSIDKWGMLSTITVAATDVYNQKGDKSLNLYIVDSNHRYHAIRELGKPFYVIITRLNSCDKICELMSALNNTNKPWTMENFVINWAGTTQGAGFHYLHLQSFAKKYDNYTISILANLLHFGNLNSRQSKMIKKGSFRYNYPDKAVEAINIFETVNFIVGDDTDGKVKIALRSINFRAALLDFVKDNKEYLDVTKFIKGFADNLLAVKDLPYNSTEWRSAMNKYYLSTL